MKDPKIKLIVGFRREQEHSISADEAHKAYYLFLNPDKRGIFSNGLAILGSEIKEIVPDYHGTMGWNSTHILDSNDWNELMSKGIERKIRDLLAMGKEIAISPALDIKLLNNKLSLPSQPVKEIESRFDTTSLVKKMSL